MSVEIMSLVFKMNMPELKTDDGKTVPDSTAKFVLLALADHANDEGEGAYPSVKTICQKTNMAAATVCNALNALRTNGFTRLEGRSKRDTYNYTILVAEIRRFQWLKSDDFSGWNPSVSAAEIKPSINHPETINGADAPNLPLEWQIAGNTKQVVMPDNEQARRIDFANLAALGTPNQEEARKIALAFQNVRGITLPESKVKGQRKAVKEMLEMGVRAEHVEQATRQLMDKGMTVADLFSVTKTAIDIANSQPKRTDESRPDYAYRNIGI